MSQTDRKYDGPPIQELRKTEVPEPPPLKYRARCSHQGRKRIRKADVWSWGESKKRTWDWRWANRGRYSIYAGFLSYGFSRSLVARHVVRRLRAIAMQDVRCDIVWLESQDTGEQLSPEFSSRKGILNWLEYEGLKRGFLKVASFISWGWDPKTKTSSRKKYTRLEEI